jgi:hypothetical protein
MPQPASRRPPPGLDRVELVLFLFGVLAFAVLMLAFGQPLAGPVYLPLVGGWIVAGVTFVWWFDRFLSRRNR